MPVLSASPSMVAVAEQSFLNNNNLAAPSAVGLSEDEYIALLIDAVEKRPVLYNVHLLDYKNKNKKGEAFKEVQQVMRVAGCNEQQVQGTYKKWISLKRKFRVEYFKPKSEDTREASCSFPYFDSLKFLIPYCEVYKMCKSASKRKMDDFSSLMNIEEDESDDDRYAVYDDDSIGAQSALDLLINQKRAKLESLFNSSTIPSLSADNQTESPPAGSRTPTSFPSQQRANGRSAANCSNTTATSTSSSSSHSGSNANVLGSLFGQSSNSDDLGTALATAAAAYLAPPDDSPNALFGRLVANELDKMPPGTHNVVRAQVLLLLAQCSQQSGVANDRILSCLTP